VGHQLVHGVCAEGDGAEVKALEDHLVLGEGACFVAEHVGYAAELLAHGAGANEGVGNVVVVLDEPGVDGLGHVDVDAETYGDDV